MGAELPTIRGYFPRLPAGGCGHTSKLHPRICEQKSQVSQELPLSGTDAMSLLYPFLHGSAQPQRSWAMCLAPSTSNGRVMGWRNLESLRTLRSSHPSALDSHAGDTDLHLLWVTDVLLVSVTHSQLVKPIFHIRVFRVPQLSKTLHCLNNVFTRVQYLWQTQGGAEVVVSTQNAEFILMLLFLDYCIILYRNDGKPTFASPCIYHTTRTCKTRD